MGVFQFDKMILNYDWNSFILHVKLNVIFFLKQIQANIFNNYKLLLLNYYIYIFFILQIWELQVANCRIHLHNYENIIWKK